MTTIYPKSPLRRRQGLDARRIASLSTRKVMTRRLLACLSLLFVLSTAVLAATVNTPQPQTVSRITEPVNDSLRVVLKGNVPRQAKSQIDQGAVPASMPASRLFLVLKHSPTQAQAIREYIDSLQNKSSSNFHKWLTPEEFGAKYGPSEKDLKITTDWLASHGFTINGVNKARNIVEFSGTAGSVQEAFHTTIHSYLSNGETHFANATDPEIPAALAPIVAGVTKLNNFNPRPTVVPGKSAKWNAEKGPGSNITWTDPYGDVDLFLVPADVAAIYNTPNKQLNPAYTGTTYDGTGVTVGIIGGGDFPMQDVANYRAFFLSDTNPAHLPNVIIDGNDPGVIPDYAIEALLDNEILGGVAPGATINYYTAADTDLQQGLGLAINRALDDNAVSILSLSYGECEYEMGTSLNQLFNAFWEQAAAQGIAVTVSSGDTGSANCDSQGEGAESNGLAVNGFASTPYNVAVGGTDFTVLVSNYPSSFNQYMNGSGGVAPYYGSAAGYIPETVWNTATIPNTTIDLNAYDDRPIGGSGGGASSCAAQGPYANCVNGYAKPAFQANLTPADTVRDVPDVSLFAAAGNSAAEWAVCEDSTVNGNTNQPVDCQLAGGKPNGGTTITGEGGTSASTPAFAGMLALISQSLGGARLGNPNPTLYNLYTPSATAFNDIVVGNNSQPCLFSFSPCEVVTNGDYYLDGYDAVTGYDQATGLGSVNAANLVTAWPTAVFTPSSIPVFLLGESQGTESPSGLTAPHGTPLDFFIVIGPGSGSMVGDVTLVTDSDVAVTPNSGGLGTVYPVNSPSVTGGIVTGTTNELPGGTYNVYAYYGGDTNYSASKSNPIPVTITPESSATTLALAFWDPEGALIWSTVSPQSGQSTIPSIPYGSLFDLDATTLNSQNVFDGYATGTMTFLNGNAPVGPAVPMNSSGTAEFGNFFYPYANPNYNPAWLPAGSYQIVASYSGDASFNPSKSAPSPLIITKAQISTALSSSNAGLNYGGSVVLSVAMTMDSVGSFPSGSITFMSGSTVLGTAPLVGGYDANGIDIATATVNIAGTQFTKNGNQFVTAVYAGDGNYASSTSNDVLIDVTGVPVPRFGVGGPATLVLSDPGASSPANIVVTPFGGFTGAVNLTCIITGPANAVSTPTCSTENVNITGTSAATATVNVDSTSTTTPDTYSMLETGTDVATGKITASTVIPVTVTAAPAPGFALSSTAAVIAGPGSSTTSTVTVTPANGFTGVVNLTCSSVVAGLSCAPATATVGASSGTTNLTIQSTSATPLGAVTLTVNGVDAATGTITATTTVSVTVNAPIIPGLTIAGTPVTIASPGATGTSTITITPSGGLSGTITLTCAVTGSPLGAISAPACPSTTTTAGSAAATTALSLQTTVTTTPGAYTIAVTATAGSTVATTNVALTVNAPTVPASFALAGTQVSIASLGANGSSTITVTPAGGFIGQVNLKCAMTTAPSGVNDNPTCSFGPTNSVFISGAAPGTATMTVNTSATAAALHVLHDGRWFGTAGGAVLTGLLFFCLPTRRRNRFLMLALLIVAVTAGASGCGGSSTPAVNGTGAFTFTVTGADAATGTIVSTTTVTVNVQ
jgi:trimeric autotransporter adhesin